jgi:cell division protein FtsW (lipid II flippase)
MGGTSIIFTSAAFGVLLSVSRSVEEQKPEEEKGVQDVN